MGLRDLKYAPRRYELKLVLDDNIRAELEAARLAVSADKSRLDADLASTGKASRRLEKAEAAVEEAAVSFVFEALPRPVLAALIEECPPTSDQLEQWKERDRNSPLIPIPVPEWDLDTFTPRLIAASLVEPETTEDEVVEIWEDDKNGWSDAIWAALWLAAWDKTNQAVTALPTSGTGSRKT